MQARLKTLMLAMAALVAAPATAFAADECKVGDFCLQIQGYYLIDFVAFIAILLVNHSGLQWTPPGNTDPIPFQLAWPTRPVLLLGN